MLSTSLHDFVDLVCKRQILSQYQALTATLVVCKTSPKYDNGRRTSLGRTDVLQAASTTLLAYFTYNLVFHPLSSYPGPLLWRAFRLPYVFRAFQGRLVYDMLVLHKRYGPIVRVAPNELALAYEGVWEEVQGGSYDSDMPKWDAYYRVQPNQTSFIMSAPPEDHSQMRRALSYGFSNRGIRDMEPRMIGLLDTMVNRLLGFCSGGNGNSPDECAQGDTESSGVLIDLTKWINFTTFDVIGTLTMGESFECLETGEYHFWVKPIVELLHYSGILAVLGFYPRLQGLLLNIFGGLICRRMDFHQKHTRDALERRAAKPDQTDLLSESLKQTLASSDVSLRTTILSYELH